MGFGLTRFARKGVARSLVASGLMVLLLVGPGQAHAASNTAGPSDSPQTTGATLRLE